MAEQMKIAEAERFRAEENQTLEVKIRQRLYQRSQAQQQQSLAVSSFLSR